MTIHSRHLPLDTPTTMGLRAWSIIFWQGMTNDIERRQQSCSSPSIPPSTLFEQTYANYFDCAGQHYLVVGDRLSEWSEMFQAPKGSPQPESNVLISCLRNYSSRFGVPDELSSKRGQIRRQCNRQPKFVANVTDNFLSKWGVCHRLSSAYNPQSNR